MSRKKKNKKVHKPIKVKAPKPTLVDKLVGVKRAAGNELLLQALVELENKDTEKAVVLYCLAKGYTTVPVNVLSELIAEHKSFVVA